MFASFVFLLSALPLSWAPVSQSPCASVPAPTAVEAEAVSRFNGRIERYLIVHRAVEESLPGPGVFDDAEDMFEAIEAMQSGIREARPNARPGDIFSVEIAALIRRRLLQMLVACNYRVEDVLAFINEERLLRAPKPRINQPFPWELGSAMWPTLLDALPPLPEELQYRFADRDLVLIDMHADMVVDILVDALPAPGRQMSLVVAARRTWTAGP